MAEEDAAPLHGLPPCSRLCVKNLPKYVTEKRLRDHFAVKGEVTDVKILKTRQGLGSGAGCRPPSVSSSSM